ncbi:SDR family oxidoreductase [Sphingomonas sp. HF-S4]|uniref:SDR family oxidoreductase n=1 Tax=Sphingomonas agrestis TaxID=3080540 RepID=A0ABU3Y6M4_9SPHN|nr:SDR family oxidoreductase [Sphingomonas sp. HF-S4]MDV3457044.1 SDR family oxidoreductase [Sphingomonas sp. HF-S4]
MKTSGNTILITGGGSGIGAALAQRFHAAGNRVIVAGRRQDALDAVVAGREGMFAMTLDVESAEGVEDFARRVMQAHPELNVLINNAGIMRFEDLAARRDLADAEATITTNLLGPIRLSNALIDHLAAQADAAIVNVTSGLAYVPLVDTPTYNATKAAIHSYTVSLREALKGKVDVIELVPPAVQTGLTPGQENRSGYMPLDDFIDEVMALFGQSPTPGEILVERVKFLRDAEGERRFDATLAQLNDFARKAREG